MKSIHPYTRHRAIAALAVGLSITAAATASGISQASAELTAGSPLWLAAPSGSQPVAAKDDPPITVRFASSSVKSLAESVLATRFPCAGVALTQFDPQSRSNNWYMVVDGVPTSTTLKLIARDASNAQIRESLGTLGSTPYDPNAVLAVAINVSTKALSTEESITTVRCEIVDPNGTELQRLEPAVRFTWNTSQVRLLGIYSESGIREGTKTASTR
jgi:hypothetical protein